jgi:uncharacterized protein YggE
MDVRRALLGASAILASAAIAVAVIIVSAGGDDTATAQTVPETRGISVTGDGSVTVRPDTAWIDFGVQATANTVAAARTQAADAMVKVIDALKANGIAETDIQTTSFSIQPQYDYPPDGGTPTLRGYVVANTVSAKIKGDANALGERAGTIIDAVAAAGGNLTTVSGVRFSLEDPTAAMSDARARAFADARKKAEELAGLASVTLGDPIVISEGSSASMPIYGKGDYFAADGATPIQAGELQVAVNVSVTFAIS